MTELRCSADTCAHNDCNCCCKGNINVKGSDAYCTDDTCCQSFQERKGTSVSNACCEPKRAIDICCDAVDCRHNQNQTCHAPSIEVQGHGAHTANQTACGSFVRR